MKKLFLWAVVALTGGQASADKLQYAAEVIHPDLLQESDAVVRSDECRYEYFGNGKARIVSRVAITILREAGNLHAVHRMLYDRFSKITHAEGTSYDAMGKRLAVVKGNAVSDGSVQTGSFADDIRHKAINLTQHSFPYTVEFSETKEFDGFISLPRWFAVPYYRTSVELATLEIRYPEEHPLLAEARNWNNREPQRSQIGKEVVLRWNLARLHAFQDEQYAPEPDRVWPIVYITPQEIRLESYKGSMKTWSDFSAFIYQLNEGRHLLGKKRGFDFDTCMTADPRETVKRLYAYLQKSTRYVSIQLGIGGWQSHSAEFVYSYRLGDCKALTTYMKAMLEWAGIPSIQVLVRADGPSDVDVPSFPYNIFNHMILAVPLEGDTIWLECTSSEAPFGYLGNFTEGHLALALLPEGADLFRIPVKSDSAHRLTVHADITFTGSSARANLRLSGDEDGSSQLIRWHESRKTEKIKEWIRSVLNRHIRQVDSLKVEVENGKAASVTFSMDASDFFSRAGQGFRLPLQSFGVSGRIPENSAERKSPVYNDQPSVSRVISVYRLPPATTFSNLKQDTLVLESGFGRYQRTVSYQAENSIITTDATFEMLKFDVPAFRFSALREFLLSVVSAEKQAVTIKP